MILESCKRRESKGRQAGRVVWSAILCSTLRSYLKTITIWLLLIKRGSLVAQGEEHVRGHREFGKECPCRCREDCWPCFGFHNEIKTWEKVLQRSARRSGSRLPRCFWYVLSSQHFVHGEVVQRMTNQEDDATESLSLEHVVSFCWI